MYNVENRNASTVMSILKNGESELPADHARVAAYIEIVRESTSCIREKRLIVGLAFTYVSRSRDLVKKKASILVIL
jgi:hypothetical protein